MERTKKVTPSTEAPSGKIWWKKVGGGTLRFNNRIYKPNEKFLARPDQIPAAHRDVIIPLEEVPGESTNTTPVKVVNPAYEIRPRGKSTSQFDVWMQVGTDEDGEPSWKRMTEKPLSRKIAESMVEDLSR